MRGGPNRYVCSKQREGESASVIRSDFPRARTMGVALLAMFSWLIVRLQLERRRVDG